MKSFVFASTTTIALFTAAHAFAAQQTVKLNFDAMWCPSCGYIIKQTLVDVEGVRIVEVVVPQQLAVVTFEDTKTDIPTLRAATRKVGYLSTVIE